MREGFGVRDCGEGANVEVTEAMRDLGVSVAKMTKMLQSECLGFVLGILEGRESER